MRFDKISIPAFGPFTDFSLDFKKSAKDIHLIYGANEAGKSSLLRAIHQMLYGIPARSSDTFIHQNNQLRVGASLSQDSDSLTFVRKKGNANTLLDESGNTIDDKALTPYLGSVDEIFFANMFGLDTTSLRKGAKLLLAGEESLSTIIFSASLGGSPIDEAIKKLEAEAAGLFKGNARVNVTILPAIKSYKESEKEARDASISPTAWRQKQKDIEQAIERFSSADQVYGEHHSRLSSIDNTLKALPTIQALKSTESELQKIEAPDLSSDFVPRLRELQKSHRDSARDIQKLNAQLSQTKDELAKTPKVKKVLTADASIQSVINGRGSFQIRSDDELAQKNELSQIEPELSKLLERLDFAEEVQLDSLPLVTASQLAELKELNSTLSEQTSQLDQYERDQSRLETQKKSLEQQVGKAPRARDISQLENLSEKADAHASATATQIGDLDKLKKLEKQAKDFISRLDIAEEDVTRISTLKVPSDASIQEQRAKESDLLEQHKTRKSKIESFTENFTEEKHQLDTLKKETAIYTREDLTQARETRDQQWQTIQKNPADASDDDNNSLSKSITLSDDIADTLHNNAETITKAETHQANIELIELKKKDEQSSLQDIENELSTWQAEWDTLCKSIPAPTQSPTDLLQWRELWSKLCECLADIDSLKGSLDQHDQNKSRLIEKLQQALGEVDNTDFDALHDTIKSSVKQANQQQGSNKNNRQNLTETELELKSSATAFESLKSEQNKTKTSWEGLCKTMALPLGLTPASVLDLIDFRQKAKDQLSQKHQWQQKLKQTEQALSQYKKDLQALTETLLPKQAKGLPTDQLVSQLQTLLENAKKTQTQSESLTRSRDTLEAKIAEEQISEKQHEEELQKIYRLAEVSNDAELESVITKIENKIRLSEKAGQYRDTLRPLAGHQTLVDFISAIDDAGTDALTLETELDALKSKGDTLLSVRDEAKAALDAHQKELTTMQEASDDAARHKQDAANVLSRLVNDVDRFVKLQHAIAFLKQQVEAYRKKTQAPMIEKTSHYFCSLTGGSFSGVAAQLDDKGSPQLVALRSSDSQQIHTDGLSEGSADQLYLALRLAAIDLHLINHPAIPLILDDLLVTFDDERTRSLLPVLEELSQKTQILIFTHHQHLIDLSKKSTPSIQQHLLQ